MGSEDKLREEIIICEKARNDLLKWKLLLVGAMGSTGLGLRDSAGPNVYFVLCLIPLVCVYVDLHCTHLWLQIHVIGAYLRRKKGYSDYENFAQELDDKGFFSLEKWILYWSTIFLSVSIAPIGFIVNSNPFIYILSGVFGITLSLMIHTHFKHKLKILKSSHYTNNLS